MYTEQTQKIARLIEETMENNKESSPYILSWMLAKEIMEMTRSRKYTINTNNLETREQ